jgi:NAD(P)-dependent dehydrogenase (short-subunit alcohol dehydrogenase family)
MNQQRDLERISALVTGATSGIGRAAAGELGRHGAEVVVHGRDIARGSAVVDTIAVEGGKARFVAADLTDPNQPDGLVDQAGPVDVLVNNAGFSWVGPTGQLRHRRGHRRRRRARCCMTRAAKRQRRRIPAAVPSGWAAT